MTKWRRRLAEYFPYFKLVLLFWLVIFFLWGIYLLSASLFKTGQELTEQVRSTGDRINILFLGIPGQTHQGEDLTDTLIFFSINHQTGEALMLSLPRDIWVSSLRAKLNTAYHYGEQKKPGGGLNLAKVVVSEILGQPIHYSVLLDFDGFIKAIDAFGGVEIEVAESFDDYQYPIPGKENDDCDGDPEYRCRYEHLYFEAGLQKMDGERALKYVRSRYAEGDEGSDFARSRRQQRLLLAFKKEAFSFETLRRPGRLLALIRILKDSVKTDIPPGDYLGLAKLLFNFDSQRFRTEVLDFLVNPPPLAEYDYHWVLVPEKDWPDIHQKVTSLLEEEPISF